MKGQEYGQRRISARTAHGRRLLVGSVLGASLATAAHAGVIPAFVNATNSTGIDAVQAPLISPMFCGGSVGDFNNDGYQDVFWIGGGTSRDKLFINNGDGTFTEQAEAWGCNALHRSAGAAIGDYDGNGYADIYVTCQGTVDEPAPGHHKLYHNNGDGTFTERAVDAGVSVTSPVNGEGTSAAWGDYDLDGDLDLAVSGYGVQPLVPSEDANRIFRNDGDGTFTDVTVSSGAMPILTDRFGFGPRFVDLNDDRYPEIIWIADFGSSRYLINNGDGTFSDGTAQSHTALGNSEMGFDVADFNGDGRFDFYVTTILNNRLYINNGNHQFSEIAENAGVDETGIGWAAVAVDFDHDTFPDLAVACMDQNRQYLFRNNLAMPGGQLTFTDVTNAEGFIAPRSGRGLARFDYDLDGDQDLILFPGNGAVMVFRSTAADTGGNWLRVVLDRGDVTDIAPNGIGAVVKATFGTRTMIARIDGGTNYLSQNELSAHFGLDNLPLLTQLTVEWPNGMTTTLTNVPVNRHLTILPDGVPGDATRNGVVDYSDVLDVIGAWGTCGSCDEDLDHDRDVDFDDLLIVLNHWS